MGKLAQNDALAGILTQLTTQNQYLAALHGDKANLHTTDKTSLISAINEVADGVGHGISYDGELTLYHTWNASLSTICRRGNLCFLFLFLIGTKTITGNITLASVPEICRPTADRPFLIMGLDYDNRGILNCFKQIIKSDGTISFIIRDGSWTFNRCDLVGFYFI